VSSLGRTGLELLCYLPEVSRNGRLSGLEMPTPAVMANFKEVVPEAMLVVSSVYLERADVADICVKTDRELLGSRRPGVYPRVVVRTLRTAVETARRWGRPPVLIADSPTLLRFVCQPKQRLHLYTDRRLDDAWAAVARALRKARPETPPAILRGGGFTLSTAVLP